MITQVKQKPPPRSAHPMLQGESCPDFIASNGWLDRSRESQRRQFVILLLLLAVFVLLQCALPLASAIKIGADEDFAVQKAFLSLKGYRMYTDIWDDQPPLHTYLLKQVFLHISNSIFAARLLSVGAAMVLLSALFLLASRVSGILAASVATALLIACPGFLELSASAMVEIPGLAPAVAALCLLYTGPVTRWRVVEVLAGTVFAIALQIKAIEALYLPLAALILWLRYRDSSAVLRNWLWSALAFGLTAVIGFLTINHLTGESLTAQIAQARASHFTATASVEYGSPADHARAAFGAPAAGLAGPYPVDLRLLQAMVVLLLHSHRRAAVLVCGCWGCLGLAGSQCRQAPDPLCALRRLCRLRSRMDGRARLAAGEFDPAGAANREFACSERD